MQWIESSGRQRSMSRTSPSRIGRGRVSRDHACASAVGQGVSEATGGAPEASELNVFGIQVDPDRPLPEPSSRCQHRSAASERVENETRDSPVGSAGAALTETEVDSSVAARQGDPGRQMPCARPRASDLSGYQSCPIDPPSPRTSRAHGRPHAAQEPRSEVPARMHRSGSASGNVAK